MGGDMVWCRCVSLCVAVAAAYGAVVACAAERIQTPRGPLAAERTAVRPAADWVPRDDMPTPPPWVARRQVPPPQEVPAEPEQHGQDGRGTQVVPEQHGQNGRGTQLVIPDQQGQDGRGTLTLEELESIALANNPTVVQAAMRVRAARAKCLQVGLKPNPTLSYAGDEMGDEGRGGMQGARIGQEIVTGGKLQARVATASREVEQAEQAFQAQRYRVLNDVRSVWFEALVAQRAVDLNAQLVEIGNRGVKAAEGLLSAKEVSRIDVLQAKIEADSAKLQLNSAQNRQQAVWRRLAAVLGTPDTRPVPLAGDLEGELSEVTWDDAIVRLLQESPELAEARAGVQRARNAVAQQCAERVPNVDLRGAVQYNNASGYTMAGLEVGMALPVHNRNQGNIARAEAQLIAAHKEVRRVELALQERMAGVFEQYANAREEVAKYGRDILPNAKTSLDLVHNGYRQGQVDYLTLLTAQRTYFRVNLAYLEGLRQYRTSRVSIDGLLLSGGLRAGNDEARTGGE